MYNHCQIPDGREIKGSQDSVGIVLGETCSKGEVEPIEATSNRQAWPLVEGCGHPPNSSFKPRNIPV